MIADSKNIAFEGIDPNLKVVDEDADAKRWEGLNKKGEALTKETYESWTEELHNLLIFAGLFSAIVTAFTIEAAKTIQGDPAEMTVLLLQTIVLQLYNQSNPQSDLPIPLNPAVTPLLYAQRINVFYSVSLVLSLVAVLGGILCLQWLREFGRNITGVSNKDDLSLQHQRHESLRKWGVLIILNMLPLFLLIALGLFFIGFMVSQWESRSLASGPVTFLVVLSGGFIVCTTVLPTCQFLFLVGKSTGANNPRPVLCPYRSPQSWLFHLILQKLFLISNLLSAVNTRSEFLKALEGISSWMDYDTNGVKRWKEKAGAVESIHQSLLWISREYRQVTTVALDAYSCMVYTSCYGTRMKLKEWNTLIDLKWNWDEQELLTSFEGENNLNDTEKIRKISAKAVIDATVEWNNSAVSLKHPTPLSDISALEESIGDMDDDSQIALLEDIATGLRSSETTWVTPENAVAVTCQVIDRHSRHWRQTIPIVQELCKHPTTRSLPHIRHLCNKLRDKLSSEDKCDDLIWIFNRVFRPVDSAHHKDVAPILGRLLVECDKCFIDSIAARHFLKIIEDLASKRLIGKESSLNNIFLYTKYILQRSYGLSNSLLSIETTLDAILSAAEYAQHSLSEYSVLHPNQSTIPRTLPDPDYNEDLQSVWAVIDNFNVRLMVIWGIYEVVESGGEISASVEDTGQIGSEIHNTEDLPMATTPNPIISSSTSLQSNNFHEKDLHDETTGQITPAIYSTEALPTSTTPSSPAPLQSNKFHEIATTPCVGTQNPVSPVSSSSQDFEHSSNCVSVMPADPHARSEIPLATNTIETSASSQHTSPLYNETSTSQDSHVITPSSQSDGVGLGTVNQASAVQDLQSPPSTPSLRTHYHAQEITGPRQQPPVSVLGTESA